MEDLKVYMRPSPSAINVAPLGSRSGSEAHATPGQTASEVSQAEAEMVINLLKQTAAEQEIDLDFSVHEASGRTMIKVVDNFSHKVVREIPPKEVLDMIANIEKDSGQLLSTKI